MILSMRRNLTTRHHFSLVELMIAMTILSLIMMLVMWILVRSQSMTRSNSAVTQIHESARVAMDIVERDIRTSVTSSVLGREIGFYLGTPAPLDSPPDSLHLCLVSSTDPPTNANSRLAEISYRHHADPTTTSPIPPFTLMRQIVTDTDSANWDFRGRPLNWWRNDTVSANGPPAYERVIGGVAEFSIKCFDSDDVEILPGTELTEMPFRIEINLVVFDERLADAPESERFKTQRSFTKIIRPGDLQSN